MSMAVSCIAAERSPNQHSTLGVCSYERVLDNSQKEQIKSLASHNEQEKQVRDQCVCFCVLFYVTVIWNIKCKIIPYIMAAYIEKIYRFAGGNQEMKLRLERLAKGINLCLELFSQ